MREKVIEKYMRDQVKTMGGKAYKFVSPGNNGVPDRLCILPGGRIFFVETKAPGKKPTGRQLLELQKLSMLGCTVYPCVDSKEAVDSMLLHERRRYVQP